MPALHNYECQECKYVTEEDIIKPEKCLECGSNRLEITYKKWHGLKFNRNREFLSDNDNTRVDEKGFVRKFSVEDDRLCQVELGMNVSQSEAGLKTFEPEKSLHYLGKFLRDGDSPSLRKEILAERAKGQADYNSNFK